MGWIGLGILIAISILIFLPFINADIITPGYSPIKITNTITNINEFPDYIFISGEPLGNDYGFGPWMCPLALIEESGTVSGFYYKFCSVSVFAIKKDKWDAERAKNFTRQQETEVEYEEYLQFMNSMEAKEVVKNVDIYREAADSGIIIGESNYYTVDLNEVKTEPDRQVKQFNYVNIIIYPLISLIALIIIITILVRRKHG